MKKIQRGQVLPLGLVLVVMGMVGALMVYNTGVVATDKMRLANSADAAAYSGALWQARALNYQAYANRAMVANQVAIGQAVSIQSWMTSAAVVTENIEKVTSVIPVLNSITATTSRVVTGVEALVGAGAEFMLLLSNGATQILSLSQDAMIVATVFNTAEMISVVAKETDSRFTTTSNYGTGTTFTNSIQWLDFNEKYTGKDEQAMKERQEIIMASRDEFTRSRNWSLFGDWFLTPVPLVFQDLKRQGQTQLASVKTAQGLEWEWMAKDTLSYHTKFEKVFWDADYYELPLGWASAFANSKNTNLPIKSQLCVSPGQIPGFFSDRKCARFTKNNHDAEFLADINYVSLGLRRPLTSMKGYGGVRNFWGLSEKARTAEDARLTVRVEVSLPVQQVNESDTLLNAEELKAPVVVAGGVLSSLSLADVYYRHPQHHFTDQSEHAKANAYNPYWQVQLVPVSEAERKAVLLLRADNGAPTTRN
ncbi:hypothetical protein N9383_00270 [Granulosicoccus sp.]|nr:hypothetical protein [Granulosicoccus sp.]